MIPAGHETGGAGQYRLPSHGRYEDLLRASIDWEWDTDADLRLTHVSPPVARHLGMPPQRLVGRYLTDLGDFEAADGNDPLDALRSRRPFRDIRILMDDSAGERIPFRLSGVPYYDPRTGAYAGHRGTALREAPARAAAQTDAHALLSALEHALLRHNDLEWRLDLCQEEGSLTGERLAKLLHELRTPLNAVVGYAELARRRVGSEAGNGAIDDNLKNVCEAGRHMARLIDEIDFAATRSTSQRSGGDLHSAVASNSDQGMSPDGVDLSQVVGDARAMTELSARRAGLRFANVSLEEATTVCGNRKALTQILVNLLANAVKFTPPGGEVGVEMREAGPGRMRLAIWDTGPGIPPEEQERIFQSNYRMAQHSSQGGPEGSGLGLAIARQLAEENAAKLTVESTPGGGATFILDLKLFAASNVA